jgi:hypothetical protein
MVLISHRKADMAEDSWSASTLALLAQRDPQQLQLHADNIRRLEFLGDDSKHHGLFKNVRFPTLECIVLDASDQNEEKLLEPYLQPALKEFSFFGGPISDAFLEKLQVCTSYLSYFRLLMIENRSLVHNLKSF